MEHWLTNTGWVILSRYSMYFVRSHLTDSRQLIGVKVLFLKLPSVYRVTSCEGMCQTPYDAGLHLCVPLVRVHNQSAINSAVDIMNVYPLATTY